MQESGITDNSNRNRKERQRMATPMAERNLEATARITSKGQITVPVEIRNALEVKEGDQLRFVMKGGVVFIEPIGYLNAEQLYGIFKHPQGPQFNLDLEALRDDRAEEIMKKYNADSGVE